MANLALEDAALAAKLSGMHWWDETVSHAVERTAGFCDGYDPIASMLKKRKTALNFTCVKPEGFVWQVLKAVWTSGVIVASENALPCYNRLGYRKILEVAKPRHEPYSRCISSFTYRGLNQTLLEQHNLREFALFVKKMHGTMNNDQLNYVARPIEILDQKVKRLRNKTIDQVKVKWDHRKGSDTTWESKEKMRRLYPHLFGVKVERSGSKSGASLKLKGPE